MKENEICFEEVLLFFSLVLDSTKCINISTSDNSCFVLLCFVCVGVGVACTVHNTAECWTQVNCFCFCCEEWACDKHFVVLLYGH